MKNKAAIVNASPLISLAIINKLDLLLKIFHKVVIPSEVAQEVTLEGKLKSKEIDTWITNKIVESIRQITKAIPRLLKQHYRKLQGVPFPFSYLPGF